MFCMGIFDVPALALECLCRLSSVYQRFSVPVYTIPGNHDLFGHNIETLPSTMLGFAARLGIVHLVGGNLFIWRKGVYGCS